MIAILDHLEVNTKVSNTNIKTVKSNNCRKSSGDNGNANGMLAIIVRVEDNRLYLF